MIFASNKTALPANVAGHLQIQKKNVIKKNHIDEIMFNTDQRANRSKIMLGSVDKKSTNRRTMKIYHDPAHCTSTSKEFSTEATILNTYASVEDNELISDSLIVTSKQATTS